MDFCLNGQLVRLQTKQLKGRLFYKQITPMQFSSKNWKIHPSNFCSAWKPFRWIEWWTIQSEYIAYFSRFFICLQLHWMHNEIENRLYQKRSIHSAECNLNKMYSVCAVQWFIDNVKRKPKLIYINYFVFSKVDFSSCFKFISIFALCCMCVCECLCVSFHVCSIGMGSGKRADSIQWRIKDRK